MTFRTFRRQLGRVLPLPIFQKSCAKSLTPCIFGGHIGIPVLEGPPRRPQNASMLRFRFEVKCEGQDAPRQKFRTNTSEAITGAKLLAGAYISLVSPQQRDKQGAARKIVHTFFRMVK